MAKSGPRGRGGRARIVGGIAGNWGQKDISFLRNSRTNSSCGFSFEPYLIWRKGFYTYVCVCLPKWICDKRAGEIGGLKSNGRVLIKSPSIRSLFSRAPSSFLLYLRFFVPAHNAWPGQIRGSNQSLLFQFRLVTLGDLIADCLAINLASVVGLGQLLLAPDS